MRDGSSCITDGSVFRFGKFGALAYFTAFGGFRRTFLTLIIPVTLRENCFYNVHNSPNGGL